MTVHIAEVALEVQTQRGSQHEKDNSKQTTESLPYWMNRRCVGTFAKDSEARLLTRHKSRSGITVCACFCLYLPGQHDTSEI